MALTRSIFIIAALVFTSFSTALITPEASAQATTVIVIDRNRIMRDSAGGQDIANKLQSIGTQIQGELESEVAAIDTEGRSLDARTANMTPEAVQADTALMSQVQSYARKRQAFQQKQQIRARELQQTEQTAWAEFFTKLGPVVEEVANERGAQLVLERGSVYFNGPALDATDVVIQKMNAVSPTVTVTRARLQAPPQTIE